MRYLLGLAVVVTCLLFVGCASTNPTLADSTSRNGKGYDSGKQLKEHITNSLWQWDGDGGEQIIFNGNGYIEHQGWTSRRLVTRWEAIDRRTILFEIDSGRKRDVYAVLVFSENLSSFDGFNFHGGSRLKRSLRLEGPGTCGRRASGSPGRGR